MCPACWITGFISALFGGSLIAVVSHPISWILSVVLILSLLIKYGKETKLGGWLSSRWSEARARYEYHGPTAELGSWSN